MEEAFWFTVERVDSNSDNLTTVKSKGISDEHKELFLSNGLTHKVILKENNRQIVSVESINTDKDGELVIGLNGMGSRIIPRHGFTMIVSPVLE